MAESCLEHQKYEGRPRTFIILWKCGCLLVEKSERDNGLMFPCARAIKAAVDPDVPECRQQPGKRYFVAGTEVVPIAD